MRRKGRDPVHRRTYNSWRDMVRRCCDPKNAAYPQYGGRGIYVAERWMQFENFLADMGYREADQHIDRVNPDKGYTPENCRWVSRSVSAINRRMSPRNTSGYRGVSWSRRERAWKVLVIRKGRSICAGTFIDRHVAAHAYNKAAIEHHGKNARLNVPGMPFKVMGQS